MGNFYQRGCTAQCTQTGNIIDGQYQGLFCCSSDLCNTVNSTFIMSTTTSFTTGFGQTTTSNLVSDLTFSSTPVTSSIYKSSTSTFSQPQNSTNGQASLSTLPINTNSASTSTSISFSPIITSTLASTTSFYANGKFRYIFARNINMNENHTDPYPIALLGLYMWRDI